VRAIERATTTRPAPTPAVTTARVRPVGKSRAIQNVRKANDEKRELDRDQLESEREGVSAIRTGTYAADDPETSDAGDTLELEDTCPRCENRLSTRYVNQLLAVTCPDHGFAVGYPVPPTAARARSLSELLEVALSRHGSDLDSIRQEVCPHCWGDVDVSFPRDSVPDLYVEVCSVS